MWTDDPEKDFRRWDAEMERKREEWEASRPKCAECGEPITDDHCIDLSECFDDEWVFCEGCAKAFFEGGSGEFCELLREVVFDRYRRKI